MKKFTDSQLAQILWNYHYLGNQPSKADCIVGLGSNDIRVAEYCAELYKEGFAPFIIFSGNVGNFTRNVFTAQEAYVFRDCALKNGVPSAAILIEDMATNIGENIVFTKRLLHQKEIAITNLIIVTKPNTQRRAYATVKKIWPEINAIVLSPYVTFDKQPTAFRSQADIINEMVGDLQRIKLYPQRGFQIQQDIPEKVWQAYRELIKRGYTHHLMQDNDDKKK
jgi:uncharacterized SAM-binding protein YcdF (DUF218 family)